MKKKMILLLIIFLTIGYASVSLIFTINGKITVAFDNSNLQVIFKKVMVNNEDSEKIVISDDGKSFVYIADNLVNVGDTANISYDIKNQSTYYDANVVVSCKTDYGDSIEYDGNTLNQVIDIKADEGYSDTLTTKLKNSNTSGNSITLKCELLVNPISRDSIMLGREYNVDFDANGGTTIDSSIIVKYYEKYGELPLPTRKGYEFLGWYTEDGVEIDSSSLVKVKDNHTLLAKWKENTYQLINDVDGDGRADIGDEIEVREERFYVISYTDTELNALAKYNLKVGGIYNGTTLERIIQPSEEGYGRQDASMVGYNWQEGKKYGTVALAKTGGWASNASVDLRNEKYRVGTEVKPENITVLDALYTYNEETGIKGYEKYLQEFIPSSSVRLITKKEVENLVNGGNSLGTYEDIEEKAKAKGYTWLYSTTYWGQTSSSSEKVWNVYSHGSGGAHSYMVGNDHYSAKYYFGVRPVITVKNNLVNIIDVFFNTNGGSAIDINKKIEYGNEYGELPIPTKKDCEFLGWYTESGEKIESTTIMKKYQDHTLTARWKNVVAKYEITNDKNYNGEAEIGEEIKVGTESFYVISNSGGTINALAKYNLNVGNNKNPDVTEGIQHETVKGYLHSGTIYGTVAFSDKTGWPNANNATIDIRNQAYGAGPVKTALYGDNGYEKYVKQTISNASVRLITKKEIEVLVNGGKELSNSEYINSKEKSKEYSWLYSTSYWTQSSNAGNSELVFHVDTYGCFMAEFAVYNTSKAGVRPVITIPES